MRVRIAEACGWIHVSEFDMEGIQFPDSRKRKRTRLPDYPRFLDAMALAEAMLTDEQRETYIDILSLSFGYYEEDEKKYGNHGGAIFATALQRARAFCKTIQNTK